MSFKGYVYFGLSGDFDPVAVSSRIGISPGECVAKHSKNALRRIPRTSLLRYAQTESEAEVIDVYEMAEKAVDLLEPHLESITSAIEEFNAEATFNVVLDFPLSDDVSTPAIGFSRRVVAFVAAVKASIDIDTYRA
jgi:hypothetical protein